MSRPVVLFLCTGNSARSQMAEALLRHYAGTDFDVHSAGLAPKPIDPMTIEVLEERGLDLRSHRSKGVQEYLGRVSVHHAIIVCDEVELACPKLWPFALSVEHWPFDDPASFDGEAVERRAQFRLVRDQIDRRIQEWLRNNQGLRSESEAGSTFP